MSEKKLFVFDLDDTLMWNAWMYSIAQRNFFNFLCELWDRRILGLASIMAKSQDIDLELGKEINPATGKPYGFSMERFPTSLVRTYKWLCDMGFGEYDDGVAKLVYEIGMSTFDKRNYELAGLVPNAQEVLDMLKADGHPLALVTKGDTRVQRPKVDILGLKQWFRYVRIVDSKSVDIFAEVSGMFGFKASATKYTVGNSFYSDIQPGLDAGYQGIYIPCPTWEGEKLPTEEDRKKALTVPTLAEMAELYKAGKL